MTTQHGSRPSILLLKVWTAHYLAERDVSQAEVSRMTGIPSPHLTDMKKSRRRCTPEYDLRLSRYLGDLTRLLAASPIGLRTDAGRAREG